MKSLSLKQPVPELILQKRKTIETRTWKSDFHGEFLLHASSNLMADWIEKIGFDKLDLERGAIVGSAKIEDIKKYSTLEQFNEDINKHIL